MLYSTQVLYPVAIRLYHAQVSFWSRVVLCALQTHSYASAMIHLVQPLDPTFSAAKCWLIFVALGFVAPVALHSWTPCAGPRAPQSGPKGQAKGQDHAAVVRTLPPAFCNTLATSLAQHSYSCQGAGVSC